MVVLFGKFFVLWQIVDIGDYGEGFDYVYDFCMFLIGVFNIQMEVYNLILFNEDNVVFIGQELCNDGGIQV